jgi:hypothetical protein
MIKIHFFKLYVLKIVSNYKEISEVVCFCFCFFNLICLNSPAGNKIRALMGTWYNTPNQDIKKYVYICVCVCVCWDEGWGCGVYRCAQCLQRPEKGTRFSGARVKVSIPKWVLGTELMSYGSNIFSEALSHLSNSQTEKCNDEAILFLNIQSIFRLLPLSQYGPL